MFNHLKSLFANSNYETKNSKKTILELESLEDRVVPTSYIVNNLGDAGAGNGIFGDLRYCINQSNANPGNNAIAWNNQFNGVINLNGPLPSITSGVAIDGGGLGITVNANGNGNAFNISSGVDVIISGLTITGGSGVAEGGGINNHGHLTLRGDTITNCSATKGGGLASGGASGSVEIEDCTIKSCNAQSGGGIYNVGGTVSFSSQGEGTDYVSSCNATGSGSGAGMGGGIYNNSGSITVGQASLALNYDTATENGGGIFNAGAGAGFIGHFDTTCTTYTTVKFNGDTASNGGGLYNGIFSEATLTDCYFEGDKATTENDPNGGYGGAMYLVGGGGSSSTTTFDNTTVDGYCFADVKGPGVLYESGASFPNGFNGLTDEVDQGQAPVQK